MSKPTTYHITDTETASLEFGAEIVELAWIEIDADLNIVSEFEQRYRPTGPINPAASAAHGLTAEDLVDCPPSNSVPALLGVNMIAHNSQFDAMILERFWEVDRQLCTCRAAQQLFPDAPDHKLQTLKFYLGLRRDQDAHSAMGDIRVLYELLRHMVDVTGLSLEEFITETNAPIKHEVMPFGKHKGTPIRLVPYGYKKWLASLADPYGDWELTLGKEFFE